MKDTRNTKQNKFIRKGDKVFVTSGNFRGQTGTVLSRDDTRAVIQGVNVRKKHVKRTQNGPGQILEIEKPISLSNVRLCIDEQKPVKVRVRTTTEGKRELYYNDGQKDVVYRSVK
jgi:large subunit ribosomal protein L24